jgi:hypothetical protein
MKRALRAAVQFANYILVVFGSVRAVQSVPQ